MPEVVEITLTAQWLNSECKNKNLEQINILSGRYTHKPIQNLNKLKFPLKIKSIKSKGKMMYFILSDVDNKEYYIVNRFGLTGEWTTIKNNHSHIEFVVSGISYYFSDYRNFGTIDIYLEKSDLQAELDRLAPDALQSNYTCDEFYDRIVKYRNTEARRNREIIKVLMDQTNKDGICSGLGNYLSVEILYHARISPRRQMNNISRDDSNRLCESIKYITKLSYVSSDSGYLEHLDPEMKKYITKFRNTKNYHPETNVNGKFEFTVYQQKVDKLGNPVRKDKIITGRTTYWVPNIQH